MADHRDVYASHAEAYDALVSREDHRGALAEALLRLLAPNGDELVVELGAGTGRVTRLVAPHVTRILAYDNAPFMLAVARRRLAVDGLDNVSIALGDNAALPAPDAVADAVVAGWTVGYPTSWAPEAWEEHVDAALAEMRRVARAGARLVVIETLGTGHTEPRAPAQLAPFYRRLESRGWEREVIRTDYGFASVGEAERLVRPFFGDALADRVRAEGLRELPECTGIWHRPA